MSMRDPLYKQIKLHLQTLIEQNRHNPHFQLPSETQLAHTFNASRSPIQKAMSELKEEGLIYKIHGKGTFINNQNQQPNTLTVYMLVPHMASRYMQSIIQGAHDYFKDKDVFLLLTITDDDEIVEQEKLEFVMKQNFSGILFYPIIADTYHNALFKLLLDNCQVVVIGHHLPRLNFSSIHCDYHKQIYKMTEYLLQKGHSHIAFISESGKNNFVYRERIQGYWDCITHYLDSRASHLLEIDMTESTENIRAQIAQFFSNNREVTAVITISQVAETVFELTDKLDGAQEGNISVATIDEPENIHLTSHDHIILLDQMPYQIGWKAAEQLYNQILNGAPTNEIITADRIIENPQAMTP